MLNDFDPSEFEWRNLIPEPIRASAAIIAASKKMNELSAENITSALSENWMMPHDEEPDEDLLIILDYVREAIEYFLPMNSIPRRIIRQHHLPLGEIARYDRDIATSSFVISNVVSGEFTDDGEEKITVDEHVECEAIIVPTYEVAAHSRMSVDEIRGAPQPGLKIASMMREMTDSIARQENRRFIRLLDELPISEIIIHQFERFCEPSDFSHALMSPNSADAEWIRFKLGEDIQYHSVSSMEDTEIYLLSEEAVDQFVMPIRESITALPSGPDDDDVTLITFEGIGLAMIAAWPMMVKLKWRKDPWC